MGLCLGNPGALKGLRQGSGAQLDTVCARYAGVEEVQGTFGERRLQVRNDRQPKVWNPAMPCRWSTSRAQKVTTLSGW